MPSSPTIFGEQGFSVRTATLDEPEHGLTEAVLAETDVLTWGATPPTMGSAMRSSTGCTNA